MKTISVLPAGSDVPLSEFVEQLSKALESSGRVLHLNREHFESIHGKDASLLDIDESGKKESDINAWLCTIESEYKFILYESDIVSSAWTRRCLRQADKILLVGRAAGKPELNEIEAEIIGKTESKVLVKKELVLLHETEDRIPVDTQSWLNKRSVMSYHHVRLQSRLDFERLSRFLSNRAIGLVLGGEVHADFLISVSSVPLKKQESPST